MFFSGYTGVGKTELAKSLAEFVLEMNQHVLDLICLAFNSEHSDQRLIELSQVMSGMNQVEN